MWYLTSEKIGNETYYCVSNGIIGNRSFSYDFKNKEEAKKELDKQNN